MDNKIEKWFELCSDNCFGIELPSGWIGRPFDNQHQLVEYKVEQSKIWFKFDGDREISIYNYEVAEFTKNMNNNIISFSSFSEAKLLFYSYDKTLADKEIKIFNEGKISLYGYFF